MCSVHAPSPAGITVKDACRHNIRCTLYSESRNDALSLGGTTVQVKHMHYLWVVLQCNKIACIISRWHYSESRVHIPSAGGITVKAAFMHSLRVALQ